MKINSFGKTFQKRLNAQYEQNWHDKMSNSARYKELSELKDDYEKSPYLTVIENHGVRNIFSRLRLDMNKLEICQGRQRNIPRDLRKCPICKTAVETIAHFILECDGYRSERTIFISKITEIDKLFLQASKSHQLKSILNVQPLVPDHSVTRATKLICRYVKDIYTNRLNLKLD